MKATTLSEKLLRFIERHFTVVAKTQSFFKLNLSSVLKIISSNSLDITSELEVFAAGDDWVSFKLEQRKQHAIKILQKIRLHLLSESALKYVLQKPSSFKDARECYLVIKNLLTKKKVLLQNELKKRQTHRYCNQNFYSFILCGGSNSNSDKVGKIHKVSCENFKSL